MTEFRFTGYNTRNGSAAAASSSTGSSADTPLPSVEPDESEIVFSGSESSASRCDFNFRTPSFSVSISSPEEQEPTTPNFTWSPSPVAARQSEGTAVGTLALNLDRLGIADQTPPRVTISARNPVSNSPNRLSEGPEPAIRGETAAGSGLLNGATTPRSRRRSSSRIVEPRYQVHEEDLPEDAFNAAGFQSALAETKSLVVELERALASSSLHQERGSAMHQLYAKTVQLSSFQQASKRKMGFVGDAGTGKSSLINSLLDMRGLIRSSNNGAACTCVATEFHFHELPTFHIEVELLEENELLDQLVQLLQSYRHFHFNQSNMDEEIQRNDFEERAQLAEDTFSSMFPGRVPSQMFLLRESEDETTRQFRALIREMRPSSASMSKFGLSQQTCANELRVLSSPVADPGARSAWPYIRRIRVSLNAHILSKGLVLVDLPGLRDLNSARRNITELYLRECHDIFAVCSIGRATTDQSVQDVLRMARQLPDTNVGIVCTKSDDVVNDEALHDWQGERGQRVRLLQGDIENDEEDFKTLNDEYDDYIDDSDVLTPEETARLCAISSQIRRVRERLEMNKFRLQSFLIESRNELVSRRLTQLYADEVSDGELEVFCVSNYIYKEKRDLPKTEAQRHVHLSGIPTLRRFCISVVSESQYRAASQFIQNDVPAVIGCVDIWLQSGADTLDAERRLAVTRTLDEVERQLGSSLLQRNSPIHQLSRQLVWHFRTQICDRQHVASWSAAAQTAGQRWGTWAHNSYAAFCRHFGNHTTAAMGWHDWNMEAMEAMVSQMTALWRGLEECTRSHLDAILVFIDSPTNLAMQSLEDGLGGDLVAVAPLRRALLTEQRSLTYSIEDAFTRAEIDTRTLHTDGLSSLRTSFFGTAMESTYEACNQEYGTGVHARRKGIMSETLSRESLFTSILDKMRDRFTSLADSLQDDVTDAVNSYLATTHSTLELVRNENTAEESQRDLAFHGRVNAVVRQAQEDLERIRESIQEQVSN